MDTMRCIRCFHETPVSADTLAIEKIVCPECGFAMLYGDCLFLSRMLAAPSYFAREEFLHGQILSHSTPFEGESSLVTAG